MIKILCKNCNTEYKKEHKKEHKKEDRFILIYACPKCRKDWTRNKVSGVNWKVYPKLKKILLDFSVICGSIKG